MITVIPYDHNYRAGGPPNHLPQNIRNRFCARSMQEIVIAGVAAWLVRKSVNKHQHVVDME